MKNIVFASIIILVLISMPARATDVTARQLVDHLYITSNQLPIQDMMIILDVSRADQNAASPTAILQPASRDKIFFKRPNKLRVDSVIIDRGGPLDGKQVTIIRDGINRWMYVSAGEYPVKKGQDEPSPTLLLPFNIQTYQHEVNYEYVILGREVLEGITTDVVGIVNQAAPEQMVKVWIDPSRWVPLKLEMQTTRTYNSEKEKPAMVKILYKEIKQLKDGRWMPFILEFYRNEILEKMVVYRAVAVNVGLQDNLFEPMQKFIK